jgi:hypothetical protein
VKITIYGWSTRLAEGWMLDESTVPRKLGCPTASLVCSIGNMQLFGEFSPAMTCSDQERIQQN